MENEIYNYPIYWEEACECLAQKDPFMKKLISSFPDAKLYSLQHPFKTLIRAIVGQQISIKAADNIWLRISKLCDPFTPLKFSTLSAEQLKDCGLSWQKIRTTQLIAQEALLKEWDYPLFKSQDKEVIIENLLKICGVGPWTVDMFMIFCMLDANIFPLKDVGLHKGIAKLYGLPYPLAKDSLDYYKMLYQPYCTVAVWYLWRSLDPVVVSY